MSTQRPTAPNLEPNTALTFPRVDDPTVEVEVLANIQTIEDTTKPSKTPATRTHVWTANQEYLGHIDTPATNDRTPRAYTPTGSLLTFRTRREALWSLVWEYEVRHDKRVPHFPGDDQD